MTDISPLKRAEDELRENVERLKKVMSGVIRAIDVIVETRDPYTAGHQHQVARLATAIATEMGLPADTVEAIYVAASIHDLGKIYVPAEILSKPGHISDIERGIIRTHPQVGYDILKSIDFPWPIAEIVLQHHERIDGSGYPRGLKDGDIRIEARILGSGRRGGVDGLPSSLPADPRHREGPRRDPEEPGNPLRPGCRRCLSCALSGQGVPFRRGGGRCLSGKGYKKSQQRTDHFLRLSAVDFDMTGQLEQAEKHIRRSQTGP